MKARPRLARAYQLEGAFAEKDFPVGGVLRVWEFGIGDEARLVSHAAVRRAADGALKLESNAQAAWNGK